MPAMISARCQHVRGGCIAGKPGSYRLARALLELACLRWPRWGVSECAAFVSRASPAPTAGAGLCWSWLACDSLGAVSVSARRLHRGQDPLLQVTRALLELACLRWPRRGASECAASASRASPAPTAGAGPVGAGLPAMASARCQHVRGVCIAGKPGSYSWRGLCWSWLACDGLGAVSVSARRLHRGQARLLQLARALLELACLRWPRRGVSTSVASASRASPAPTAGAGSVGAGLPAMASARCQ